MANLLKRGGDNLLDGLILGALFGILAASTDIIYIKTVVDQIWNTIAGVATPTWLSWAGESAKVWFFGGLGAIIGWAIDRF